MIPLERSMQKEHVSRIWEIEAAGSRGAYLVLPSILHGTHLTFDCKYHLVFCERQGQCAPAFWFLQTVRQVMGGKEQHWWSNVGSQDAAGWPVQHEQKSDP